ncbi:MAG: type II secretion system F family protein, partial [Chloroflexota bacterium]|nr:type II secretion system F family protein [Chloroflexota bacterium]
MSAVLALPSLAFLSILLLGLGLYRTVNHGGIVAKQRVAAFAPAMAGGAAHRLSLEGGALFKRTRFSAIGFVDRLLQRRDMGEHLSLELARAALPLRVAEYLLIRWLAALAVLLLVRVGTHSLPLGVVGAAIGYFAPVLYVRQRQQRRLRQFDDQLVDALVLLANALKSGYSFLQGMETIAREMPDPIGVEFQEALREIRIGGPVDEGLMGIAKRVRSPDFELVVTAMVIQRQVGGNLAEVLANIAYTVRERHRILREVRVLTSQERMSGYIVAALPVALTVLLSMVSPTYLPAMFAS